MNEIRFTYRGVVYSCEYFSEQIFDITSFVVFLNDEKMIKILGASKFTMVKQPGQELAFTHSNHEASEIKTAIARVINSIFNFVE